jgi:Zn-dependent protease
MTWCPSCRQIVTPVSGACPSCGAPLPDGARPAAIEPPLGSTPPPPTRPPAAAAELPLDRPSPFPPPAVAPPRANGAKRGLLFGILAVLGAILFKGKGLALLLLTKLKFLLVLFKLKGLLVVLKSGGSMLLMIWVYASYWPLPFAIGFTILLLVHELGHAFVLRGLGIPFSAPIFIPFLGALIGIKKMPPDVAKEALVAFGGPFLGTIGAQVCLVLFERTGSELYLGLAQIGYFLNLFNLAPFSPLDGGRIVGAISPKLWLLALPFMVIAGIYYHSLILLLVAAMGVPRAIAAWKGAPETQAYFRVSSGVRFWALTGYLALGGFIALMMHYVSQLKAG